MRESNDARMFRGALEDKPFDGSTRAQTIALLLDAHNHEYYKALGQTLPRQRRGLDRKFGALVTPLAAAAALLFLCCTTAYGQQVNTREESAAIMANGRHWSNVTTPDVPLPAGVVGEPIPSLGLIYWRGVLWSYRVGYIPSWPGGYRGTRGRRR